MEYNYVVFGHEWDLYRQSYSDLVTIDNARYIAGMWDSPNPLLKALRHIHLSREIQKKIPLPFRSIWNPTFFKDNFKNHKPICFVFFIIWLEQIPSGLITYLRWKYKDSKFVLFSQDLVEQIRVKNQPIDVEKVKKEFDLWISFDQSDCNKYNLTYHPLVFSSYHGHIRSMPSFDVYFLGAVKNRYQEILKCIEKLWEYGVTTDINLVGVNSAEQKYKDKIHYIDNMQYLDNLQHVLHCNCELEIMQAGGFGYTQRMCEVISLDKKLITNNPMVHEAPFYNPDYIFQIEKPSDITKEMCEKIKKKEKVDYHYKEKLSPIELLEFIDNKLKNA